MRKLIYSMTVSLDGFIAGPDGSIDFSAPDAELHRFHNERMRGIGIQICGRRLYETMRPWDTPGALPESPETLEFARIWKDVPKVVFSTTLERVGPNGTLVRDGAVDAVRRMKDEPGKDLAVGGASLAASLIREGLVDDFRPFISPVVLGGGTPYLPALERPIDLELVETRTFASRIVYARYRLADRP